MLAYACALLPNEADAEDVLHQVFLRLLSGGLTADLSAAYLFRAVRNRALNDHRRRSKQVELQDHAEWLLSPSQPRETVLALQSALVALPEDQREVVVLHVWGQLTFEEIGRVVAISPNTAASRYRYGLTKLRELWNGRV